MCGLTGIAGPIDKDDLDLVRYLGILSSLRGLDSTGFMDYRTKGKNKDKPIAMYSKTTQVSLDFFAPSGPYTKDYVHKGYRTDTPVVQAVHTRAATIGKVTQKNSHPFHKGKLVGMHNGSIHHGLDGMKDFETDSECLYHNLNKKGDDFLRELSKLHGAAYALVWINIEEKTLNFFRNFQRPLYMGKSVSGMLFWASDRNWLETVLPYFKYTAPISMLESNTKVSYDLTQLPHSIADSKKEVDFTPIFPRPDYSDTWTRGIGREGTGRETYVWSHKTHKMVTLEESRAEYEDEKKSNVLALSYKKPLNNPLENLNQTFGNIFVSDDMYKKILDNGCCGCHRTATPDEKVEFIEYKTYICSECLSQGEYWVDAIKEDYREQMGLPKHVSDLFEDPESNTTSTSAH